MLVLLATANRLAQALWVDVTINPPEEGDVYLEGHTLTLRGDSVCVEDGQVPMMDDPAVLLGNLQLRTIGGALRLSKQHTTLFSADNDNFWAAVAVADLDNASFRRDHPERIRVASVLSWLESNKPPVTDGAILDVTQLVLDAGDAIRRVLDGDPDLLGAGVELLDNLRPGTWKQVEVLDAAEQRLGELGRFLGTQGRIVGELYDARDHLKDCSAVIARAKLHRTHPTHQEVV